MATPFGLLIRENLKTLFSTKGFLFIVIAAFIPPGLTAAWVFTHENDVRVSDIHWTPDQPSVGQMINITVKVENRFRFHADPFNVTIRVGYPQPDSEGNTIFNAVQNRTLHVDGLNAGESRELTVNWTPGQSDGGSYIIDAVADSGDVLPEVEERNNDRFAQLQVRFDTQRPTVPSSNATNDPSQPSADIAVENLTWTPSQLFAEKNATFTAMVHNNGPNAATNVSVKINVYSIGSGGFILDTVQSTEAHVDLAVGESKPVNLTWQGLAFGLHAVHAAATGPNDPTSSNNNAIEPVVIDREVKYVEPPEKATIKDFYRDVLQVLHFRLLIPLIALFYAAGVLQDEKDKGNLLYLLTRPLPRWQIPVARFLVSFVVAGVALVVGIIATYVLLLGTPQSEPGYFYWPVLFSVLTLFVYTAFFTLVGVLWERPYMIGLVYTMAFEAFILLGRSVLINGRPLLQGWVENLSLSHWILVAFKGWDPKKALQVWPEGSAAVNAIYIVLAIGVGSIVAASFVMKRREFDV